MQVQPGDPAVTPSRNKKCSALTGSARKIKDNAADWHNLILKWEKLNDEGTTVATAIVNLRTTSRDSQKEQQMITMEDHASSSTSPSSSSHPSMNRQLEEACGRLVDIVDKMDHIVGKMEHLVTTVEGVVQLELFQFGPQGRTAPLFISWPTARFVEVSRHLFDSYSQELKLKRSILQEVAHWDTSDLSMVLLSCWLYQPYIQSDTRLTLESLLLETGHRPL